MRPRVISWTIWIVVVFGLFNASHSSLDRETTGQRPDGDSANILVAGLHAWRTTTRDGGDIERYFAYANAALGRPYQGYFIRDIEAWKSAWSGQGGVQDDPSTASSVPAVVPPRPLKPWRDYMVEYPPGIFLAILPSALLSWDLETYHLLFSISMGLLLTGALLLAMKTSEQLAPGSASRLLMWSVGAIAALGTISVRRYDALVALSLMATAFGLIQSRGILAGGALGIGFVTKLIPAVTGPFVVAYQFCKRDWRGLVITVGSAVAVTLATAGAYAFIAGPHAFDIFLYHATRPIQIESTAGSLLLILRHFQPQAVTLAYSYGSENLVSIYDGILNPATAILPLLCVGASLLWASRRISGEKHDKARAIILIRSFCIALVALMVLGKVLSPQYLTWLVPLGVLASTLTGRTSCVLFVSALALTQVEYPHLYSTGMAVGGHPVFAGVVLLRNCLLAIWAIGLIRSKATS